MGSASTAAASSSYFSFTSSASFSMTTSLSSAEMRRSCRMRSASLRHSRMKLAPVSNCSLRAHSRPS